MNLNELYEKYRNKPCESHLSEILKESQFLIYSIVYKVTKQKDDSEDITQEVLIKIIKNINFIPIKTNFTSWLSRVALNAGINFYRQKKRNKAIIANLKEKQNTMPIENQDETVNIVYQHLSKLDGVEQTLVINKHVHGMTFAQLSNLYNLPISTIELKIKNTLIKLKISLEKAGFAGVALALASTLDQLQATEVVLDLLPGIKSYFPSNYPNSTPKSITNKVFSKPLLLVSSALVAFLIYGGVSFFNEQNKSQTEAAAFQEKPLNNTPQAIVDASTTKVYSKNPVAEILNNETSPIEKDQTKDSIVLAPGNVIQSDSLKSEYAGQLLDAVTKEPIAGAKLEIWDIYTYKKFETTTDAEGKYLVPDNLDKTFFFYLKFIKEGYAVKQTFQHFSIPAKIKVFMGKGEKIHREIKFDEPANGDLYIGGNINLSKEKHLSKNQKENLLIIYGCLIENAPLELYTLKKIKLENVTQILLEESFERFNLGISVDGAPDFEIYRENFKKRETKGFIVPRNEHGHFDTDNYTIRLAKTGKLALNKQFKIFDKDTQKEDVISTNSSYKISEISYNLLSNAILTLEGNDYFGKDGGMERSDLNSNFSGNEQILNLTPFTTIIFEPLSLENKFNNAQALFQDNQRNIGDSFFSKNSMFKKSKQSTGTLKVYDMFFEEILLSADVRIPIGGVLDINAMLHSTNDKNIKISITLNDKPLKKDLIWVGFKNEETLEFGSLQKIQLDKNGIGLFKMPNKTKKIKINFYNYHDENTSYSKIIDVDSISNDLISLNFNKQLSIKINQDVIKAKTNAEAKLGGWDNASISQLVNFGNIVSLTNESTLIEVSFPFSDKAFSVFVEKEAEYNIVDDGFSVKTVWNHLRAFKPIKVNDKTNNIEIKPASDSDYSSIKITINDENGNDIPNLKWFILEDCDASKCFMEYRKNSKNKFPIEFCSPHDPFLVEDNTTLAVAFEDDPKRAKEFTVGDEALESKTIQLLNNRKYFLSIYADGYVKYLEYFSIQEEGQLNKKVILYKSNSIKFQGENRQENVEITKLLKQGDVIYEYNGVRIINQDTFLKTQQECNQETVSINLIRDNMPMKLMIPTSQIFGLENHYYEDKDGILNKGTNLGVLK